MNCGRSVELWKFTGVLIICHLLISFLLAPSFSFAGKQEAYQHLSEVMDKYKSASELRFLQSYVTLPVIDPDRYIQDTAYIYDNALALLAFLARNNDDDMRRARILADAFVYAMNNDRYYADKRLRNAYSCADLIDGTTGKVKLPGWWDPNANKWYEDEVQVSSYTGNLAWVMIALLAYYEEAGGASYLAAAQAIGQWIEENTRDLTCVGGYMAGYKGWEPNSTQLTWKSTEHNIDVYVAFMRLYQITRDSKWQDRANHAREFVEVMWDPTENHFWTGTNDDRCTVNKSNVPLDIQAWAIMALNDYPSAIAWVENHCNTESDGFKGFDFNTDRDGVWFEGTAQMSIAYQLDNQITSAQLYIAEIKKAQQSATNANQKGIVAASHDGVTTGFEWEYFSRLHIGATAWYIFAEACYNPYWGTCTYWYCSAVDLGDAWRWLLWLGYFNVNYAPWVYHKQHEWLYPFGACPESLVFWDTRMNAFWWTSEKVYPFLYRFSDQAWLWYLQESSNPRWFYNYSTSRWESH